MLLLVSTHNIHVCWRNKKYIYLIPHLIKTYVNFLPDLSKHLNNSIWLMLMWLKIAGWVTSREDPDQVLQNATADLGLNCLIIHVCLKTEKLCHLSYLTFCVGFHRSDGSSPLWGSSTGGWSIDIHTSPFYNNTDRKWVPSSGIVGNTTAPDKAHFSD